MPVNHYDLRHYYKGMARILDHEVRTGQRRPGMDRTRAAALAIEDCEAEGRVTPKEINEAVENVLRAFMENVEERVQARKEEYLREMRMRRGESVCDEWEEEEHPRDEDGRFTFKGAGRSGGSAKPTEHYEEPESDFESPETAGEGSSRFGPGKEQLVAAVGNMAGILGGKKQGSAASKAVPQRAAGGKAKPNVSSKPAGWEKILSAVKLRAGGGETTREKLMTALKIWAGKPDIPDLSDVDLDPGMRPPSTVPYPVPGGGYSGREIVEFTARYNQFKTEFEEASMLTGVPVDVLVAFAIIESGIEQKKSAAERAREQGKSTERKSTASGIMQITNPTHADLQKLPNYDAVYVWDLGKRGMDPDIYLGALRLQQIARDVGIDLTNPDTREMAWRLRLYYFTGTSGGERFFGLKPDDPVSKALSARTITGNREFFMVNGRPATRREAEKLIRARMDKGYAAGVAVQRDE